MTHLTPPAQLITIFSKQRC